MLDWFMDMVCLLLLTPSDRNQDLELSHTKIFTFLLGSLAKCLYLTLVT